MRLVLVGPTYPYRGGIAHHTTLLARALRASHEVLVISPKRGYPRWLFPGRTDQDPSTRVVVEQSERILAPLLPWTWWAAARRASSFAPDLALLQWWSPYWAPSLATIAALVRRRSHARIGFVCHNVLPHEGGGRLMRSMARLALDRGDAFVVHSEADARNLRELVPSARGADAVRRGLLPSLSVTERVDRTESREMLGLAEDARVALFFGFVRPYKGLNVLVDALPLAARDVPNLQLLVAGEFWGDPGDIVRQAAALGVVDRIRIDDRYIPNEEVPYYFAAADVVVLPYLQASQSGVVTQASDAGVPVIASRIGGLPDAVDDGVNGLLVPPGDATALADALRRVLADDAAAAALRQGVEDTASRFSWEATVRLVESLVT